MRPEESDEDMGWAAHTTGGLPRIQLIFCLFLEGWLIFLHFRLALHSDPTASVLGQAFDFTRESSLPTYWSAIMAFAAGGCFITIGLILRRRGVPRIRAFAWLLIGLVFLVISADDVMAFHERLGSITSLGLLESLNYPSYPWHLTTAPFFALGLLAAAFVIWRQIAHLEGLRPMLVLGFGCFAAAVSIDFFEGIKIMHMTAELTEIGTERLGILMLVEEVMEMAGTAIFLYVAMSYLCHIVPRIEISIRGDAGEWVTDKEPEKSESETLVSDIEVALPQS